MQIKADRLRRAMDEKGYSEETLAAAVEEKSGETVTKSAVSHWLTGKNGIGKKKLNALSDLLSHPREYFTGEDPEEKSAAYYAQEIEKEERKRLKDKGIRPAFLELLENEYNCTIETLNAWLEPKTGRFWVDPDPFFTLGFDNYDIKADAVKGVELLPGRRDDVNHGVLADRFVNGLEDPETVPAAVFHVTGKGKDFALSLEELLQLQRILGGFIRSYIEEKSAKISSAEPIRQRVEVSEDSAGNGSGSQRDSSGSGSGSK